MTSSRKGGHETYREKLQDFVNEYYRRAQQQNGLPFDPVQWYNRENRLRASPFINKVKYFISSGRTTHVQEGNIENEEVQGHTQGNCTDKEHVFPKRQTKQAFVFGQRVHRVEHFDRDQDRQAHRGCVSRLNAREHIAPDFREQRSTLMEVCLIASGVIASDAFANGGTKTHKLEIGYLRAIAIKHKPPGVSRNCSDANVDSNDHVTEEEPFRYQWLSNAPWRNPHNQMIRGIETQCSCRQAVGNQVDPEQLHRDKCLWHAKKDG